MKVIASVVTAGLVVTGCVMHKASTELTPNATQMQKMASALSAAPDSVSADATIRDWDLSVLREGSNGFTCLPDNPETDGPDPMCMDASWLNLGTAWMNKEEPSYDRIGISYMLGGDGAVSNTDPYASSYTNADDWVSNLGAHLMIVAPGNDPWAGFSTDPFNGGPWVMWPGTPYEHLMVPVESYNKEIAAGR